MEEKHKSNPDSAGLGWWGNQRFVVGYVEEVNGPGAVEIPGFVPTRHELIRLVKYWATVEIELDFDCFVYQCTGSSEIRRGPFASRRIARIAEALGEEEVAKAVREAHSEFAKGIDPRTWNIFLNGTPEEQQKFQDEIQREMCGVETAEAAERIEGLLRSLGVDCLVPEQGKAVRFAMLPFKAAAVEKPPCIVVPVVHYLNAGPEDGRYTKNPDGSAPPIEWAIRHVGLSPLVTKQIKRLPDEGQTAFDIDIVMSRPDRAWGHEFLRICQKARWKLNSELGMQVEKAGIEAANALAAKLAVKAGVAIFDDFQNADPECRKASELAAFLNDPDSV